MSAIAIIGGTGELGRGLAARFAAAGHQVIIGSRDLAKAEAVAAAIAGAARAASNADGAAAADILILTVPFAHQRATIGEIIAGAAGKILIDTTVCLAPPKVGTVQLPPEGSAGLAAHAAVAGRARLVAAFHNVSAHELQGGGAISCDILITGDDREACTEVAGLCADIGARGLYAGPIANSVATEALTSVLITINRQFKVHAGIRITELP